MKVWLGLRVLLTLFVVVLLPLEQAYCAFVPRPAPTAAVEAEHLGDDDRDCCPESSPAQAPELPTDACCCANIQLPAVTAPTSVSLPDPASVPVMQAVAPAAALALDTSSVSCGIEPDARSSPPPDPSAAPRAPRGPPYSA